ncbi:hypothetical protein F5X97DRAFT_327740 [Nemania serpens]|nr:hypothetical protein F5X97DRAFT_327740 [Nemania serpens]
MATMREIVIVSYPSGCQFKGAIGYDGEKVAFWNRTEHSNGAFPCVCRRNEVPEQEFINDQMLCERLLVLHTAEQITLGDVPHIFASIKLGELIRRIVKLQWDDDQKIWIRKS